jgi:hypothetical protein
MKKGLMLGGSRIATRLWLSLSKAKVEGKTGFK